MKLKNIYKVKVRLEILNKNVHSYYQILDNLVYLYVSKRN